MENIKDKILKRTGIESLNAMQEAMLATKDKNLVLLAPTGSGKTIAFLIPVLRNMRADDKELQTVVVVPSRELALQIGEVMRTIAPEFRTVTFYGGQMMRDEVNKLRQGMPQMLVGTPGRLLDHLDKGNLDVSTVRNIVVDEMDKCLEIGFLPEIKRLLRKLPRPRLFILSSATRPQDAELLNLYGAPAIMDFATDNDVKTPKIEFVEIPSVSKDKVETLERLLDSLPAEDKTMVFVNHRESAERLYNLLKKAGYSVILYHGALDQQDREIAVKSLTMSPVRIMVATDLASRGLDLPAVDNVVHYHQPVNEETYIHRNGRTARAGAKGNAYVMTHEEENTPEYMKFDRRWNPSGERRREERGADMTIAVLDIGKREKISRGDILGFLTKKAGVPGNEIGKIFVGERYSMVALAKSHLAAVRTLEGKEKIKGHRFRIIRTVP